MLMLLYSCCKINRTDILLNVCTAISEMWGVTVQIHTYSLQADLFNVVTIGQVWDALSCVYVCLMIYMHVILFASVCAYVRMGL
jgi:hypothetical protein